MSYTDNNYQATAFKGFLKKVAEQTGLTFYDELVTCYGNYKGYNISVAKVDGNYTSVQASVTCNGQFPTIDFVQNFAKSAGSVKKGYILDNKICLQIAGLTDKKILMNTVTTIELLTQALAANGFVNACEYCGSTTEMVYPKGYFSSIHHYCGTCAANSEHIETQKILEAESVEERTGSGVIGALLGSLVGVAAIVLIGQAGYVAALGGVVMAIATFFGYEKLGKKLTTKGIVICTLIMIAMVFIASMIDYTIAICSSVGDVGFFEVFLSLFPLLIYADALKDFLFNLVLLYGFTALGAVPYIRRKLAERKYIDDVVNKSGRAA